MATAGLGASDAAPLDAAADAVLPESMDADAEKSAVPAPVVPAPDGLPRWARPVAAASGAELCTLAGAPSAEQSCAVAPEAESPVSAELQPLELPAQAELALPA